MEQRPDGGDRTLSGRGAWRTLLGLAALAALAATGGCGRDEGKGVVSEPRVPEAVVAARAGTQASSEKALPARTTAAPEAAGATEKQILFGDLHVHTTFSVDAFLFTLPLLGGGGSHSPADACDFARYCSSLDFFSLNDHAEAITPRMWAETKESVRECNAKAGAAENPDIVAFTGWEWTQVGGTPEEHYGHKNVIFRETAEDKLPARPISARDPHHGDLGAFGGNPGGLWRLALVDPLHYRRYFDFRRYLEEVGRYPTCPAGVDTRKLPLDCFEGAATPAELYEKLDQWGFDTLVIPHGGSWGLYTPPLASWDHQLNRKQHDPKKQTIIEVYSGHGNSEEYRHWRPYVIDAAGNAVCPEPTKEYEPCCWRAGEITRQRCADPKSKECAAEVLAAEQRFIANQALGPQVTIPGTTAEDWKDCGQCRNCFLPALSFRPTESVQYALALTNFDDPGNPLRYRFGFISSSDNHSARPGTGYKELGRRHGMTESNGARSEFYARRVLPAMAARAARDGDEPSPAPQSTGAGAAAPADGGAPAGASSTSGAPAGGGGGALRGGLGRVDTERVASYLYTGGLVAVHSAGRNREAIWSALKRNEIYGTSGDRILLWFDLLNAPGDAARRAMGSQVKMQEAPRFEVRAIGSFKQKPGCPADVLASVPRSTIDRLCIGECYNPSDERRRITRIEVVRIRPQSRPDEPIDGLIEDPWRVIPCTGGAEGCGASFEDPDFARAERDSLYYVRAIQEPTDAVNANNMRCERDANGECASVKPCYGDYRTPADDDCLGKTEERAWSSPIYVDWLGER
jgi:hypothetical protein